MNPTRVSAKGLNMIAGFEGVVLEPYNDEPRNASASHCTIGIGHVLHAGLCTDADREKYAGFTRAQALDFLRHDVGEAEAAVRSLVKPPLRFGHRFDAVVDHVFNNGAGAFSRSTLLQKLNSGLLRRGAADAFLLYDHDGQGNVLPGLEIRCKARRRLFLYGIYP